MGKGRIWTSEEKVKIVVQGLKGRRVSEICNEYQIHQTQYYKWREQFLENTPKVFETKARFKKEERLERENQKLKTMVGELTMELEKFGEVRNLFLNQITNSGRKRFTTKKL